jgi:nucleoside-diphosphate-sugar epimerase
LAIGCFSSTWALDEGNLGVANSFAESSKMRVLLTGGAGFIGSHVAEQLLGCGHELAVVDDLSSGRRENVPEGTPLYEIDVRSGCGEVFEEFEPHALLHQAAQMDVRRSVREPDFDADVNVIGTIRLLENCVKHGVRKVVFASTGGAIYGEQREFPALEDHPLYSVSPTVFRSSLESATCTSTASNAAFPTPHCVTPTSTDRARTRTARPV